MKTQAAIEYLVMIGILITALSITFYITTIRTQGLRDKMKLTQAQNSLSKIAESADLVYSQGYPSKITVLAQLPEAESSYVNGTTINLRIRLSGGPTDVWVRTKPNVDGWLPTSAGKHWISVQMTKCDYVWIAPKGEIPPC